MISKYFSSSSISLHFIDIWSGMKFQIFNCLWIFFWDWKILLRRFPLHTHHHHHHHLRYLLVNPRTFGWKKSSDFKIFLSTITEKKFGWVKRRIINFILFYFTLRYSHFFLFLIIYKLNEENIQIRTVSWFCSPLFIFNFFSVVVSSSLNSQWSLSENLIDFSVSFQFFKSWDAKFIS